jgi:hypothetical protein
MYEIEVIVISTSTRYKQLSNGSMSSHQKELGHQSNHDIQSESSSFPFGCSAIEREDLHLNESVQQDETNCIETKDLRHSSPKAYAEAHEPYFNDATSHPHAQFLVHEGVSQYPIGFYNISDAQRSDAATVCSGSILEDIEVESVLSQEDQNETKGQHVVLTAAALSSTILESHSEQFERLHQARMQGGVHFRRETPSKKMGPPQNRGLYLQKDEDNTIFDGRSIRNEEDPSAELELFASFTQFKLPRTVDSYSQSGSLKSYGSHTGIEDYEGSLLDGETHSIETKSNHSQDDVLQHESIDTTDNKQHPGVIKWNSSTSSVSVAHQELSVDSSINESSSKLEKCLKIEEKIEFQDTKADQPNNQEYFDWNTRKKSPTAPERQDESYDPRLDYRHWQRSTRRSITQQFPTHRSSGVARSRSRSRSASPN